MVKRLVTNPRSDWRFRFVLIFTTLLFLTACASSQPPIEQAIVGKWENDQGGVIQFYEEKTGFIPGDDQQSPPIPAANFTYSLPDQKHLAIQIDGQESVIFEIVLNENTMIWHTPDSGTQFVYTKVK